MLSCVGASPWPRPTCFRGNRSTLVADLARLGADLVRLGADLARLGGDLVRLEADLARLEAATYQQPTWYG